MAYNEPTTKGDIMFGAVAVWIFRMVTMIAASVLAGIGFDKATTKVLNR